MSHPPDILNELIHAGGAGMSKTFPAFAFPASQVQLARFLSQEDGIINDLELDLSLRLQTKPLPKLFRYRHLTPFTDFHIFKYDKNSIPMQDKSVSSFWILNAR